MVCPLSGLGLFVCVYSATTRRYMCVHCEKFVREVKNLNFYLFGIKDADKDINIIYKYR